MQKDNFSDAKGHIKNRGVFIPSLFRSFLPPSLFIPPPQLEWTSLHYQSDFLQLTIFDILIHWTITHDVIIKTINVSISIIHIKHIFSSNALLLYILFILVCPSDLLVFAFTDVVILVYF